MTQQVQQANVAFDKQDQYDKIAQGLLVGEQIIAVYDCIGAGTGFIGITNLRVILQDNSTFGKKVALTSIPYRNISSVSFVSDKSMFTRGSSSIQISTGGHGYEVDFRGDAKAMHTHNAILWHCIQA